MTRERSAAFLQQVCGRGGALFKMHHPAESYDPELYRV